MKSIESTPSSILQNTIIIGSSPVAGTTFTREIEGQLTSRTDSAQNSGIFRKVKFPHPIRFRSFTAKIYGRSEAYPFYRLALRVAGKRVLRSFPSFAEAKQEGEKQLREASQDTVEEKRAATWIFDRALRPSPE
jgi:hypothetical protein